MAYDKVDRKEVAKKGLDIDKTVEAAMAAEKSIDSKLAELQRLEGVLAEDENQNLIANRWQGQMRSATPGHMAFDLTYIPEYVDQNDGTTKRISKHVYIDGQLHILTPDCMEHYYWSSKHLIPSRRSLGYKFCRFSELLGKTTLLFEKGEGDTIWQGDAVLMTISMDGWDRMHRQAEELRSTLEGAAGSDFFAASDQAGVHSFKDDLKRGVREFMT